MVSPSQSKALAIRPQPPLSPEEVAEKRFKKEQLHDIELLLEDLFIREEATVKLILGALYDLGAINIINKKIKSRVLQRILKASVKLPKPLAKYFIFRWFIANCPSLITNWLNRKVQFK